ncbi:MAG: hypothetical protein AB1Z98_05225 [Nannocystaceae bacterium]
MGTKSGSGGPWAGFALALCGVGCSVTNAAFDELAAGAGQGTTGGDSVDGRVVTGGW